jgi:RNA polymerase sigma-70 factor (ECF subfamily)
MTATETETRELLDRIVAATPRVRAFLKRLDPQEVDDLLQETLTRALRYRCSHDGKRKVEAWLNGIAFRVFLDQRKARTRRPECLGDAVDELASARALPDPEERERLENALGRLGEIEKRILLLFHGEGRSVAEISGELGLPEGTVKSHLHRARRRIAALETEAEES